ncbi:ATP-binding protein [Sandaracinus amylolyticus]|uniref:histidine kinase n=1 Tax=Sandaracinus amylolyticus TaxID=927083 RepID=A0A0F6VYX5_9BACT|nr:ATP-binding protein [Sandaracinus amylolyticus]AKF03167.1 sensory box histidine kinase/response regulator [Sandaracinus amylolyticus]
MQRIREGEDVADDADARAEQRYRELASYLPDYVSVVDRERRFRWINRAQPGLSREALMAGGRVDDFVEPDARARTVEAIERVFATGAPDEVELVATGDGVEPRWYRVRVVTAPPEAGEPRVMLLATDITAQKHAELEVRASERRVHEILERLPDYVLELDRDHRIRFVNRTRHDTTEDVVIGQRIDDLAQPDMREEVTEKLERLFTTGEDVRWTSHSTVDGGAYVVHAVRVPGEPPRALLVAKDTSREQQALSALHTSESRLERALRAGNVAVWELDVESGEVQHVGWIGRVLGDANERLTRARWLGLVHPDDVERVRTGVDALIARRTESYEQEYRVQDSRSGAWLHVLGCARLEARPDGGTAVVGTVIDVTAIRLAELERRELERKLEQVQRLESIGLLAGGIAHDFNNLLTVISAGAECARRRFANGQSPDDELHEIVEASQRAASLTQQLLAFGRRSALQLEDVDVAALVSGIASMMQRVLPRSIEVVLGGIEGDAVVRGDLHRLEQVLLNLCVNARDAMPSGGRLTLSTSVVGHEVLVEVVDTGVGIAESERARIFEPFYTTKPVGTATGLGLAVAHGIVRQHGGAIDVSSAVGDGTRMTVRLPRQLGARAAAPAAQPAPRGGHETILVADDEPLVLRMAKRTLEGAGYRVIEASDGAQAVDVFRARAHEIDLVVLDVIMPQLDGWRAHQQIRAIAPQMPVILTSGYSASAIPEHVLEQDDAGERTSAVRVKAPPMLAKPYGPDGLLRTVREALDRDRDGTTRARKERAGQPGGRQGT